MARPKKARVLTKVELFYIQGHLDKKTYAEIAAELNVPLELVEAAGVEMQALMKNNGPIAYDLMSKKDKRAIVMTPSASELGDHHRQKNRTSLVTGDYVHVIDPNRK